MESICYTFSELCDTCRRVVFSEICRLEALTRSICLVCTGASCEQMPPPLIPRHIPVHPLSVTAGARSRLPRRCFRCDRLANTAGPEAPQSCRSRWDVWKWMELFGFCVRLDEDEGMDAREQKRLLQTGMVFVPSILASSRAWLLVHQLVHWGRQTM